jgi:hypothetical protein
VLSATEAKKGVATVETVDASGELLKLSPIDIKKMNVDAIKKHLKARNLSTHGQKKILTRRLADYETLAEAEAEKKEEKRREAARLAALAEAEAEADSNECDDDISDDMSHLVSSSFGRKAGRQEHTSRGESAMGREEKLKAKKGRVWGGNPDAFG